jgi:hypothetical protein
MLNTGVDMPMLELSEVEEKILLEFLEAGKKTIDRIPRFDKHKVKYVVLESLIARLKNG